MNGQPIAAISSGSTYFVRTDHIGRPSFATDDTGAVVWDASYKPFGEVNASTGAPINLRFPGQWFSAESDLNQNWMRDYDPTLGRYIQADPLGLVDGASVYGYVGQSPNRYTDFKGTIKSPQNGQGFGNGPEMLQCAAGEDCDDQFDREMDNCFRRFSSGEIVNRPACIERATIRRDLCYRGQSGPPEWSPAEEFDEDGGDEPSRPWWKQIPPAFPGPVRPPGGGGRIPGTKILPPLIFVSE